MARFYFCDKDFARYDGFSCGGITCIIVGIVHVIIITIGHGHNYLLLLSVVSWVRLVKNFFENAANREKESNFKFFIVTEMYNHNIFVNLVRIQKILRMRTKFHWNQYINFGLKVLMKNCAVKVYALKNNVSFLKDLEFFFYLTVYGPGTFGIWQYQFTDHI